ncbi:ribbon-helix-helix protein, CopG family [Patescibacteria group bacterium]|nr:ribbon-helix-helix protein, CopG family [Patescibacteria group bacterium]
MEKKCRLHFDLTKERVERLDDLRVKTGASSRSEVIKRALHFYGLVVDRAVSGESFNLSNDLLIAICGVSSNKKN